MSGVTTLSDFIQERQEAFPYATGELSALLRDIELASKIVNSQVNKAGLVNILGAVGSENVQGEEQQKLDVFANEQFINAFKNGGEVAAIASEEEDDILVFEDDIARKGKYIVAFDPLDGSSNIDVNVSIGTIFSIYRKINEIPDKSDFFQGGNAQVAAGYVIYGSSTMLVYTTGHGVNGFTLDPSLGVFCLSHPDIKTPDTGKIYSINEGNLEHYPEGVRQYVHDCKLNDPERNTPYSARYIGSMVADLHRNLIKGGVFIYPESDKAPNGKLRLLYECNPMGFIVEQAGGKASTGTGAVMDLEMKELHQRTPIVVGSTQMVEDVEAYIRKHASVEA